MVFTLAIATYIATYTRILLACLFSKCDPVRTTPQLRTSYAQTTLASHAVRIRFDNGTHTMTFVVLYFYATKSPVFLCSLP